MTPSAKLEAFRVDNPFDIATQAKRLIASKDDELLKYVVELGLTLARQRDQHEARRHIKETGEVRAKEQIKFKPGRVTGSVVPIKPGRRGRNAMQALVLDTWRVNGEQRLGDATAADLGKAINRENTSAEGHRKNAELYGIIVKPLSGAETVRDQWTDETLKPQIEAVYGEFRKIEAA